MDNRVYYKELSEEEIIDYRQSLESLALKIAYENDNFVCEMCLNTLKKILDTISLLTKDDDDFNEFADEIYNICGLEY